MLLPVRLVREKVLTSTMPRVIIAGSRILLPDVAFLDALIARSTFAVTEVISGGAPGVDRAGAAWARARGIPVVVMLADWSGKGKPAGILRNEQMAVYADALIAIWDGESTGTRHMIAHMDGIGKPVYVELWPL